ncbi:hypothetical protein FGL86_00685 [Pistricoccus aurantiacus]|uniref:Uncharacterized protein n=1 Tax=Pistricoccus aurantiacus TaxID=1883414 RepID=A0A5B8SLV0_9GAMM|nr:hypothetical protein [Pistricoccus aurantiacus]QEA37726.1 hypothetical protein FGL86_00685 [Pistricoccus aurantiacus]
MDVDIVVKKKGSVFEAVAYDNSGLKIDSLVAFSAANARRLLKIKLGMEVKKPKKKKVKRQPTTLLDSRSVMSGLQGVTSSKPWKKTK